jgi:hypothetical protein
MVRDISGFSIFLYSSGITLSAVLRMAMEKCAWRKSSGRRHFLFACRRRRKEETMSFNVKNGTPMHGPSLCETCDRAHIFRGYRENELIVVCGATYDPQRTVPFPVRECSSYAEKNVPTLYEMQKIAWRLAERGPKRAAGFVSLGEAKEGEPSFELVLNEDED